MPDQTQPQSAQAQPSQPTPAPQPSQPATTPASISPQPAEQAVSAGQQDVSVQPKLEEDEKFFAALGYFGPLFIVPLLVKPKSQYCKFHARQSMVLFLAAILILVILAAIPWFGSLLTMAIFAVYVLAIYKAYKGDFWNIPVISKFAGKMNIDALYGKAGLAISSVSGLKEKAATLADKASGTVKELGKQETETPAAQPPSQQPEQKSEATPPAAQLPLQPPATPPQAPTEQQSGK